MRVSNQILARILVLHLCIYALLLTSCGGGGSSNAPPSSAVVSGNWQITLSQNLPAAATITESGFLLQSQAAVSGTILLSNPNPCAGLGTAQGTLTGTDLAITISQIGQTVTLTGTAASDGSSMTGNYSILGSGCGGSSAGTFTGVQVKPLNSTFQAIFTSGEGSGIYNYALTLAQGMNTGGSNATLSGTMSSTDAPCGSNLNVAGVIGGTSLVLNFLAADGTAVGQSRGTTSIDGTTLTGTFDFLALNNGCTGDAGTVVMNAQAPTM